MTTPAAAATAGRLFRPTPQLGGSPPEATLVSSYNLDGGSAAAAVGGVHGAVIGTWTATDTDSMVVGDAGTSFYKASGTAHVTLPADQATHDLSELSVSFYYQAAGTGVRQILFNCGDGTVAGDFSCERQNNGKLRVWHIGQDGGLRHAGDDFDGIAGTNLVVGTADRITLTFGPSGLKVYINDTEVAGISENTNGWNNARVKYLGVWNDGSALPSVGAFDLLRIWSGQLSAGGVAALAAAQSITPPAAEGLQVPRLDVWLTNDDMAIPGTGTVRYATPGGSGVGGTTEGAAGDLQATLSASAAGHTVVCLQGYYSAPNGITFPAGSSAGNPVTVMAKPGAWAVLCRSVDFLNMGQLEAGAGEGSSKTWTLHDAATNTWRMSYAGSGPLEGCYFQNGMAHMLFPYTSLTALMSARDSASASGRPQTKNEYWFSGTAVSGGFAYIRFDRPNWNDMVGRNGGTPHSGAVDATYGAWADDGRYTVAIEGGGSPTWFSRSNEADFKTGRPILGEGLDPNNIRIILVPRNETPRLLNNASGSFTRFGSGINSMGYRWYMTRGGNHEAHRGVHYIPGYVCFPTDGSVSNVTFHRCRMFSYGEHRLQGSMAVMKFDEFLSPPNQMLQATHRNGLVAAQFGQNITNVTFDNCTLCYWHEVCVGDGNLNKTRFVNCAFHMVYDEFGQWVNYLISQIEVGYCYILDGPFGFGGSSGSGTQSPFGTHWEHHNIHDERCPRSAFDSRTPIGGPNSNPRGVSANMSHKCYNNLLIMNPDSVARNSNQMGINMNGSVINAPSTALYDECFNNILITSDTKRYSGNEGGSNFRTDHVERNAFMKTGSTYNDQYRDYNLFYRSVPVDPATGLFSNKKWADLNGWDLGTGGADFDYVRTNTGLEPGSVVFFGSSHYNESVTNIGIGWEANGSDANPQIPSISTFPSQRTDYRPQNLAAVSAPASAPSGANWWTSPGWTSYGATPVPFNMAPSPWKGALDPNGTTMPVGVQNP